MEFFRIHKDIPFMRHALVFNVISFITFAAAVFFIITRGFNLSIEFTGGTLMEVQYAEAADIDRTPGARSRRSASGMCRCRSSAPRATC